MQDIPAGEGYDSLLRQEAISIAKLDSTARSAAIAKFGEDLWIKYAGLKQIHNDGIRSTWSTANLNDDDGNPAVFVRVINSTPEPDGTSKVYWLRVPPNLHTRIIFTRGYSHAAISWTFGYASHGYTPIVET